MAVLKASSASGARFSPRKAEPRLSQTAAASPPPLASALRASRSARSKRPVSAASAEDRRLDVVGEGVLGEALQGGFGMAPGGGLVAGHHVRRQRVPEGVVGLRALHKRAVREGLRLRAVALRLGLEAGGKRRKPRRGVG